MKQIAFKKSILFALLLTITKVLLLTTSNSNVVQCSSYLDDYFLPTAKLALHKISQSLGQPAAAVIGITNEVKPTITTTTPNEIAPGGPTSANQNAHSKPTTSESANVSGQRDEAPWMQTLDSSPNDKDGDLSSPSRQQQQQQQQQEPPNKSEFIKLDTGLVAPIDGVAGAKSESGAGTSSPSLEKQKESSSSTGTSEQQESSTPQTQATPVLTTSEASFSDPFAVQAVTGGSSLGDDYQAANSVLGGGQKTLSAEDTSTATNGQLKEAAGASAPSNPEATPPNVATSNQRESQPQQPQVVVIDSVGGSTTTTTTTTTPVSAQTSSYNQEGSKLEAIVVTNEHEPSLVALGGSENNINSKAPPSEEAVKETEFNAVAAVDASITFGDLFSSLTDSCYDEYGNARYCEPEFENIAYEKQVEVSSECGKPPSRFCIAHLFNNNNNNNNQDQVKKSNCHICDSQNPKKKHPASYLTDSNNSANPTCWVSAPINLLQTYNSTSSSSSSSSPGGGAASGIINNTGGGGGNIPVVWSIVENRQADNISLVLNFEKSYEITYISMQFCSLKPDSLAIYKSNDFGSTWVPYQFYSSQCQKMYNKPTHSSPANKPSGAAAAAAAAVSEPEQSLMEATCLNASTGSGTNNVNSGRIAFLTHEGRTTTSGSGPDKSQALQDWITATNIKIVLDRHQASWIHSSLFGHHHHGHHSAPTYRQQQEASEAATLSALKNHIQKSANSTETNSSSSNNNNQLSPENSLINPSDTFNYAISDLTIGGRCKCNGHADKCIHSKEGRLQCDCRHNTAGPDCERCASFHHDRPWARATQLDANPCQPCNCNGHSRKCVFDSELYQLSGKRSGGVCIKCRDNTDGRHCHYCKEGYTRDHSKLMSDKEACKPCDCHPLGSMGSACNQTTGQCPCKEGVTGLQCNRCSPGYQQSSSPTEPCIRLPENDINSLLATNTIDNETNETNNNRNPPTSSNANNNSQEPSLASVVVDEENPHSSLPASTRATPPSFSNQEPVLSTDILDNKKLLGNEDLESNKNKYDPIVDELGQLSGSGTSRRIDKYNRVLSNNPHNRWDSQKRKVPFTNSYYPMGSSGNKYHHQGHHHRNRQPITIVDDGSQLVDPSLDTADLIDPNQPDLTSSGDGYSSANGAGSRRTYYPSSNTYPYNKDYPLTRYEDEYSPWPQSNQNERRRLVYPPDSLNNDFPNEESLPDSAYSGSQPKLSQSNYDESSTFNQIHSQPSMLTGGVRTSGAGSRGSSLYSKHFQPVYSHRNRINPNNLNQQQQGLRGQQTTNNNARNQLMFTTFNNNENNNNEDEMRMISCGDCQTTTRKYSTRQFCHLDFAIKGNVLNRQVSGQDWTRFDVEIQDIFKSPPALMTTTTNMQHNNINKLNSGARIVPPNLMGISMGYISDNSVNSLHQPADLLNNNKSLEVDNVNGGGGQAMLHRLKVGTIHSLWIPTEDFDCKCPKLRTSTTYLLMGSVDSKENSLNTLQLDRHGVAIEWKSGLQERLMKAQSRLARGKC